MSAQIVQFSDYQNPRQQTEPVSAVLDHGYAIAGNSAFISTVWMGLGLIGIGTCIMLAASALRPRTSQFS
jgi:hypothetical protein